MAKAKQPRIQRHHTQYAMKEHGLRDIIVPLTQGQHYVVSQIQRMKPENVSWEFIYAVEALLALYKPFAQSLMDSD